jgi:hypothetical protein
MDSTLRKKQMTNQADRLYDLLPAVYRLRDAAQGYPLRALLNVIAEQVHVVEADITQLYENWFIETCQDWVVPYIGSLIGYTPVEDAAQLGGGTTSRDLRRESILISRSEVANTIRYRRRKGTLLVLDDLASSVAGWPAQAVEFYRRLGVAQNINYLHLERGRTADLRDGRDLKRLGGPFDRMGRTANVRRINSQHTPGRHNIQSVGVFVWRLQAYSVTQAPAYCYEEEAPNCYLFSPLGNDTALYNFPQPATSSTGYGLTELNFPTPIYRRDLEPLQTIRAVTPAAPNIPLYYGDGKSIQIWVGSLSQPVPASQIVAADLSNWAYRPQAGEVAVDPELGRMTFPPGHQRKQGVWVSYYYAFSAGIGGGEYDRTLSEPPTAKVYLVGADETDQHINDAVARWHNDAPQHAVIEIADSGVYTERINITLKAGQTLQLRAANGKRPVIRLLDWQTEAPDNITVSGERDTWFILDGLLVTGRGIQIQGDLMGVTIRHSTLVPGWGLQTNCEPKGAEASLELVDAPACLTIEHSIVGSIQMTRDEVKLDPMALHISDSIIDATSPERVALGAPESECAYAELTVIRTTVFGQIHTQAIALAANSIFMGTVYVCRLQKGCVRFCYVEPGSRTPRRYECQPDMVAAAVAALPASGLTSQERSRLLASEQSRVEPEFNSTRYGMPGYCQLASSCASEISTGADDKSEMGVFHDLYQPLRAANLQIRLAEYTPAGLDVGIIYVT